MLAYYLSDLTTLLQNRDGEGWEVRTVNLRYVDDAILCCNRRSRQHSIASCPSKKPFRLSLMSTYHSFLVPTSSVGYRHLAVIACSALYWGLSVYLTSTWHFPYLPGEKKVPSPHGSQHFPQDQVNPCLLSWATWCPR